jgi:hypothetical protein
MYWGCKVPGLWKYLQLFLHAVDLPWIFQAWRLGFAADCANCRRFLFLFYGSVFASRSFCRRLRELTQIFIFILWGYPSLREVFATDDMDFHRF